MSLIWVLVIILIVLAITGYGWQGSPVYGGPYQVALPGAAVIIAIVLIVLLLTGKL